MVVLDVGRELENGLLVCWYCRRECFFIRFCGQLMVYNMVEKQICVCVECFVFCRVCNVNSGFIGLRV